MGQERQCTLRHAGRESSGTALLETDHILFRGDFRLKLPFASLQSVTAVHGELRLTTAEGESVFLLGEQSERWAGRILHPPSRLAKLGVKPGRRISVLSLTADPLAAEAAAAGADVSTRLRRGSDIVFFSVEDPPSLVRLPDLAAAVAPDGAVWLIYPKGVKTITESQVRAAGLAAGLVDIKVVAFSPLLTALKFVYPKAARASKSDLRR